MRRLLPIALAVLAALTAYGFAGLHAFDPKHWYPESWWPLIRFTGIYAVCAMTILILVPWSFARLCAAAFLVITAIVIPLPLVAVAFLLLSAWCLGRSILTGLAIYLCAMNLLARLPIHYLAIYIAALAIPILLRRRDLTRLRIPSLPLLTWPERLAFATLIWILAIHFFAVLKPESGADALSIHLAVPIDIAAHHVMTYQPARWVWAVMPMGIDFLWTIVYMLAGEFATHLLNFAFLILLLTLMHQWMRRWISRAASLLLLAVFASTPLVLWVTGTLMVEIPLATLLLGAFTAMSQGLLYPAALLAGAAIASKFGAVAVVVMALPFAIAQKKTGRPWIAAALLLFCAAPPYAIAFAKTGNPLFPFLTTGLRDTRFHEPLTWHTLYDLCFHSSRYCELHDGAFGIQYLILIPLALLARRATAAAAAIGAGGMLIILLTQPNARYIFIALPLLYLPLSALLGFSPPLFRRAALAFLALCIVANASLLQSIYYRLCPPLTDSQRITWTRDAAPIRTVIHRFNREHSGQPILLAEDSFHAGLLGDVYENHWHQAAVRDAIRNASGPAEIRRLLDRWRVQYVIERRPLPGEHTLPIPFRTLLANCAMPEFVAREFFLARLESGCDGPALPRSVPRPGVTAGPGTYDDFSPYIVYRGGWQHDDIFPKSYAGTSSYNDLPGAVAAFAFLGSEVDLTFSRAPNRGIATITIDNVERHPLDEYAPEIHWQDHDGYLLDDGGPHLLVIRCTGRSRPEATGKYIEIDAIDVKQ